MVEPSAALYDFAIVTHGDLDFEHLEAMLVEVGSLPPTVLTAELYGRASAGEIIVLLRFPFAAYSTSLRVKTDREAQRLKGKLVEPSLLAPTDRERFWAKLKTYEIKIDATSDTRAAVEAFRERMGLAASKAAYQLRFDSESDLATCVARTLTEGALFIPTRKMPEQGATVPLLLLADGVDPIKVEGRVTELRADAVPPGFHAQVDANEDLTAFAARQSAIAKQGKRLMPDGGRRANPRIISCLEVEFTGYDQLAAEYSTNLSKGGLFVRSANPPALRSKVLLKVRFPRGDAVLTEAEVVHVVTPEEAAQRGTSPGAGLAFASGDSEFCQHIEKYLSELPPPPTRVLVVDDDAFFRQVLADALGKVGMEVRTAADGESALRELIQHLFETDLVVLDLQMPGIDGASLIDRIRRLGGEMDLKLVVVTGTEEDLNRLIGPQGANYVLRKGTPMDEIIQRIQRVLGRS